MKRYILSFLILLSIPVYSQNFRINAGGAYETFSSINSRPVSFYGIGINYSYYFYKRLGFNLGYSRYFPTTYYGKVQYWDLEDFTAPAYIKGGANSFAIGFKVKIADPDSKKVEINAIIGSSVFIHKGTYDKTPFIRHYEGWFITDIKNVVNSVYFGTEIIFKLGNFPLFISGGYNQVLGQKAAYDEWDGFSVPFSSSVQLKAGISLPVLKGPVPSEIKKIEY
jgi:hypothetical protein